MVLRAGYLTVALKLQEAATAMCHEDIRTRLSDALNDAFRGTGNWCYVVAVFGDDKAGDLVYSCSSDLKKAAYTISAGKTTIDTAAAVDVQPLTTYETETVSATEAGARNSKRDLRQLQTIHDSAASLGANCTMAEAHRSANSTGLKLVESTSWSEELQLIESTGREVEIKLIAPGKGSSAIYPAEVLKRDGPAVFTKNTQIYINHATKAEESERPEGDWRKLAGALSTDAYWKESDKYGAGLFAMAKFASDLAPAVMEKAPYSGMSIRANGEALMENKRPVLRDGLPVLARLTSAESVDVVTRAGAGGMILTEAAKPQIPTQEAAMAETDLKKLQEAFDAREADMKRLLERAIKGEARDEAAKILKGISLTEVSKQRVIETVLEKPIPTKDGAIDLTAFSETVNREAKREGEYVSALTGGGRVIGMGTAAPIDAVKTREAETQRVEDSKRFTEVSADIFGRLMGDANAGKLAAHKGAA